MLKVSVCIQTYNHKPFIAQALDSVLMQETDFDYEIILGEDESQDGSREICIEYAKRYPGRIRLFLRSRKDVIYVNRRPTGQFNLIENLKAARGDFIALLEGDDYWTDPYKLQKQVDFMDKNPDCAICFHWVYCLDQDTGEIKNLNFKPQQIKPYYDVDDLLENNNFIPTCSVMFGNHLIEEFPEWFLKIGIGDLPLHIMNAQHGKIGLINEYMAVYRKHSGGIYGKLELSKKLSQSLDLYKTLGENLDLNQYSYRLGVSKLYTELCRAQKAENKRFRSMNSGLQAFLKAPRGVKMHTLSKIFLIKMSFLHMAGDFLKLVKENGPRVALIKIIQFFIQIRNAPHE